MIEIILGIVSALTVRTETYSRAMIIDSYNKANDEVICVDAVGLEWSFYGLEDLEVGDMIICTMSDNGTRETIIDDEIIDVEWSGYWIDEDGYLNGVLD